MEGWICLQRKFVEWEWFDDAIMVKLFIYLLLKANYEPKKWHGVEIGRGQIITGRHQLAFETNLSEQQVRTALKKLESTGEITTKTTNKFSIVTICNYNKYQDIVLANQPTNQPTNNQVATNKQPTNNQQITTTKQVNNITSKQRNNIVGSIESGENENADKSATRKQPAKPLEERENDFMWKIAEVGKGIYPDEMLRAFFNYWSDHNENGKKMLFEMQKTFDIKKRLAKWASR